jgi:hypothetical protein
MNQKCEPGDNDSTQFGWLAAIPVFSPFAEKSVFREGLIKSV